MVGRQVLAGMLSYIPGVRGMMQRGTGGTDDARYCYSVWMRHLVLAHRNGLRPAPPRVLVELGPGDSLGVGIAALLSGTESYCALDAVRYATPEDDLRILGELVELLQRREAIPGDAEFPRTRPRLGSYAFPTEILTEKALEAALDPARIDAVTRAVAERDAVPEAGVSVSYKAPWCRSSAPENESVDMVLSQSVLQNVTDLRSAADDMLSWLVAGGLASHEVDLSAIGRAPEWNGHWAYPSLLWKLMRGNRHWFLNRQPHSAYLVAFAGAGFEVVHDETVRRESAINRERLAPEFRELSDEDLTTSSMFLQGVRRNERPSHDAQTSE
ncbi:MAG: hypothetical protein ABIE42_07250 [Candidatus Eisenbacteria bacterium]